MCVIGQAVRYGLAEGVAQAVLFVSRQQYRWIGATAPRSPVAVASGGGGYKKRGVTCPVLLSADGRAVTAVDCGTGDRAVLVTATAPVRSVVVGGDGETVRAERRIIAVAVVVVVVVGGGAVTVVAARPFSRGTSFFFVLWWLRRSLVVAVGAVLIPIEIDRQRKETGIRRRCWTPGGNLSLGQRMAPRRI